MKKAFSLIVLTAVLFTLTGQAWATQLLTEDFTGETIYDSLTINLLDNPGDTTNDNLNKWIDFPNSLRWGITNEGSVSFATGQGDFAQHLVQTSDNTNLLFYGLVNPCENGGTLVLDFDYISSNRPAQVIIGGLKYGVNSLDPFAPFFTPGDLNDGVLLLSQTLNQVNSFTDAHFETLIPNLGDYDVLALGFIMGGTTGNRGVDNIDWRCVPEPSTMLLLGSGLTGLAIFGWRRRKHT